MMQEGRFSIESQVDLSRVIASNFAKLAKANFGGVTIWYQSNGLATRADNLRIGCNNLGFDLERIEHRIDLRPCLLFD
jgi:hypothetical protein